MINHTPGPWVVDRYEDGEFVIRQHGYDVEIAESRTGKAGLSREEGDANGLLIGAAPELASSLKMLLMILPVGQHIFPWKRLYPKKYQKIYKEAFNDCVAALNRAGVNTP